MRTARTLFVVVVVVGVLLLAGYYQNKLYQRFVREEFIGQDGWDARPDVAFGGAERCIRHPTFVRHPLADDSPRDLAHRGT